MAGQPEQEKQAPGPLPTPPPISLSDDELIELHREAQAALSMGVTPYALTTQLNLERAVCGTLNLSIWDPDTLEFILDELHRRAFPDAGTRPERLVIEAGGADPREELDPVLRRL